MYNSTCKRSRADYWWDRLVMLVATAIVLLCFLVACTMAWKLAHLPDNYGLDVATRLFRGYNFWLGFTVCFGGSVLALRPSSRSRKLMATAFVVFGCSRIVVAFASESQFRVAALYSSLQLLPNVAIAGLFLLATLLLVVKAAILKRHEKSTDVTAGQLSPQSRP